MAMYRYFQTEEDGVWKLVQDSPNVVEDALRQGAKKLTILAVDTPLGMEDAKRGHHYKGPLYFDIDVDSGDVGEAITSARALVQKLVEHYQTPIEAIQIYASGKKGLHVLVDQRALMPRRTAVKDYPLIQKFMAAELYVSGLDLSPYALGKNNTFRIANVKRYDGNYRVPLRYHELLELDAEGYRRLVAAPRDLTFAPYDGDYSVPLNVLFASCSDRVVRYEKELNERSRVLQQGVLDKIAQHAPPCVEELAYNRGLANSTTFNDVALNLALWAARAGVPDVERDRVFALTADNMPTSSRYPTARARRVELEGKYRFAQNSDYKFGCGAMRSLLKSGRKVCSGCPLEDNCRSATAAEFYTDLAERLGVVAADSGYQKVHGKGKVENLTTFLLQGLAAYMEEMPDGTGSRRRGTLCRITRYGEELGTVLLDESAWNSKAGFLRALEGIPGVYFTGGDADVQKIKMLVFTEDGSMPEIYQAKAVGIVIDEHMGAEVVTYIEPGRSLNNLHMVDTHRLTKAIPQPPTLFKQQPLTAGDLQVDQTLAMFARSNDPAVMALVIGWFVGCHLKAHLMHIEGQFPLLSLWGAAGSGKSKIGEVAACLHGMNCNKRSKANMSTMNRFNAIELLSSSTTVPRLCEEYNKDKMPEHQYIMLGELFKAAWNGEAAARGTLEGGGRGAVSVEIPLSAPVMTMSEQQPKMPALCERSLVAMVKKSSRRQAEFAQAYAGRLSLMRLGQYLMQQALAMAPAKVGVRLAAQEVFVGPQWDTRPAYSLRVVHMALAWLTEACKTMRLTDSGREILRLKDALTKVTAAPGDGSTARPEERSLLARAEHSEIDLFVTRISDLAVETGATMADVIASRTPQGGRKLWISPRTDYQVAGDQLYLWAKTCHARYLEWTRSMGLRTPLADYSDLASLIEHEPYFVAWKSLPGFAFGEEALVLSISELARRGIRVEGMRQVYDTLGKVDLEV